MTVDVDIHHYMTKNLPLHHSSPYSQLSGELERSSRCQQLPQVESVDLPGGPQLPGCSEVPSCPSLPLSCPAWVSSALSAEPTPDSPKRRTKEVKKILEPWIWPCAQDRVGSNITPSLSLLHVPSSQPHFCDLACLLVLSTKLYIFSFFLSFFF